MNRKENNNIVGHKIMAHTNVDWAGDNQFLVSVCLLGLVLWLEVIKKNCS